MFRSGLGSAKPLIGRNELRMVSYAVCAGLCVAILTACSLPGSVKPTVKIGLSAPFEGLYRDLGYEALYAVRLAVRERNAQGGVAQRYLVEHISLNDFNEADEALEQAQKMAVDPGVLGVLGGWSRDTQQIAPAYEQLGLVLLMPELDMLQQSPQVSVDAGFAARYAELSGGAPPGPAAIWTYAAANHLMDAMEAATRSQGRPTREGVRDEVRSLGW